MRHIFRFGSGGSEKQRVNWYLGEIGNNHIRDVVSTLPHNNQWEESDGDEPSRKQSSRRTLPYWQPGGTWPPHCTSAKAPNIAKMEAKGPKNVLDRPIDRY